MSTGLHLAHEEILRMIALRVVALAHDMRVTIAADRKRGAGP